MGTGHTSRVLLLASSPDNSTVASVAADETIRLWKIWPTMKEKKVGKSGKSHPVSMLAQSVIEHNVCNLLGLIYPTIRINKLYFFSRQQNLIVLSKTQNIP